jgi:serine/threonine protein kinase
VGVVHPFTIPGNRGQHDLHSAIGSEVGPYRLIALLGRGGMSTVWLAERTDGALYRRVALKLSDSALVGYSNAQRFLRERDILAQLEHPNIGRLYDAGATPDGRPWLALEYVEGTGIAPWCDEQRLNLRERVQLFREVLQAVQYAHTALIIHRDIKPANIMVTKGGAVRLLDFGIAKLIKAEDIEAPATMLTQMAGHAMTMAYASPEQLREEPLTTATDIYSLGVVLYELLTGSMPYKTRLKSAAQLEQAIIQGDITAPSRCTVGEKIAAERRITPKQMRRAINNDLDAIILKAMHTDRDRRYTTAAAMLDDLDRWLADEPVLARRPSALDHVVKFVRRHPWGTGLGTAAIAGLIAASVTAGWMAVQAQEQAARAEASRDFLLGLFKDADPDLGGGKELKARDLLASGAKKLEAGMQDQPALKAALLQQIAAIYRQFGDSAAAERLMAQRTALAGTLDDPLLLTDALLDEADRDIRGVRIARAEEKLSRVAALLKAYPRSHALHARLALLSGRIAFMKSDLPSAATHFATAVQHAKGQKVDSMLAVYALSDAANTAQLRGEYDSALAMLTEAETLMQALPKIPISDRLSQRRQRLFIMFLAGRFDEGWPAMQQLMADAQATFGESNPRLYQYSLLWFPWAVNVGSLDLTASWMDSHRAQVLAEGTPAARQIDWLRWFATARIKRNELALAGQDVELGMSLLSGATPAQAIQLSILQAEIAIRQGNGARALNVLRGIVALEDVGQDTFKQFAATLYTAYAFAFSQTGNGMHAQLAVERAEAASIQQGGAARYRSALATLNRLLIEAREDPAADRQSNAASDARRAVTLLEISLPAGHPTLQAAIALHDYLAAARRPASPVPLPLVENRKFFFS